MAFFNSDLKNILLIVIICPISMLSCTHQKKVNTKIPQINLSKAYDGKAVNLSSFANSIEYIPLETTDSSFIGQISQIQLTKDYIFVTDRILDRMLIFDRSGKFLNQIGSKGKGPREYRNIFTFTTDTTGQNVYLYSITDRILHYSVQNKYINTIKIDCGRFLYMSMIDSLFALYIPKANRSYTNGYSYFVIDKTAKVISKGLKRDISANKKNVGVDISTRFTFQDIECYWEAGIDTIYGIDHELKMIPRYLLQFGKDHERKLTLTSRNNLDQSIMEGALAIFGIIETDDFFVFTVVKDSKYKQLVYYKRNDTLFDIGLSPKGGFINDIDGGPNFSPKYFFKNNYLLDIKEPENFKDIPKMTIDNSRNTNSNLQRALSGTSELSNPILMVVKIIK